MDTREIKVIAWRETSGLMLEPHYLSELFRYGELVNPGDVTFLQYTGFKDNEGVEVYESYVVEAFGGHTTGVVVMHEGSWSIKTKTGHESLYEAYDSCDLHVIGNIYQNPELTDHD